MNSNRPNPVMNKIKQQMPGLFLFLGKSKSGKSYLLKYLLQYFCLMKRVFKFGLILTGSAYNHEYDFLPSKAVHEYKENILMKYVDQLKDRKNKDTGKELPPSFIVLDDCLGLVQKSKAWQNLVSTYRHLNITLFISVQYLKASEVSGTLIREQTSVLFAFSSTNMSVIKCLYDYFGADVFDKIEDFKARYQLVTKEPHAAMLYIASNELRDKSKNFKPFLAPNYKTAKINY